MGESLAEREKRIKNDPDLADKICEHISNGGTLVELAEIWDVRFGILANFMQSDPDRSRRYVAAFNDRGEWFRQAILSELKKIGLADLRLLYKEDGSLKPVNEWPKDLGSFVSSVEVDELFEGFGRERAQIGYTKKVKLFDKLRALELLGKNLAMFTEKHEHTGTITLNDLILESMKPKP